MSRFYFSMINAFYIQVADALLHTSTTEKRQEIQYLMIFTHSSKDKFITNAFQTNTQLNKMEKQRKIALFENFHCFLRKIASFLLCCNISSMLLQLTQLHFVLNRILNAICVYFLHMIDRYIQMKRYDDYMRR